MQVRHRIAIARIRLRLNREHGGIQVFPIGQFALVERQIGTGFDLAPVEARRGADDVEARMADQQVRFERFVGIVQLVDDLDMGRPLELGDRVIADIVRPIVDVEHLLLAPRLRLCWRSAAAAYQERAQQARRDDRSRHAPIRN